MITKDIEAYLVGLICGDGHIEPNRNRIIIFSSEKRFLEIIKNFILQMYENQGSLFYDKAAKEWKFSIYSKEFRDLLVIKYNIPTGNKTYMGLPEITKLQKIKFMEGLYDAEGWYETDKKGNSTYYRIKIKMKNKPFMKFVYEILKEQKIYSIFYDKGEGVYSVEMNRQDQIKKFLNKFCLYHPKWLLLRSKIL